MITVGIFSGYYPYTIADTIKALKKDGFNTVQLVVRFKDYPGLTNKHDVPFHLNDDVATTIRNSFRDANIQISSIYGYTNLLAPDPEKRAKNIAYIKSILKHARKLGSPYVITETGTYSTESDYSFHEKNHTEETYQELKLILKDLIDYAKKHDATLLIEPYVNNVIKDVETTKRIFTELGTDNFGLLMDPANYFDINNIDNMDEVLDDMFNQLDEYIYMAHAKDVGLADGTYDHEEARDSTTAHSYRGSGGIDLPAVGLGVLNYDKYVKLLSKNHSNIPLIIEHLPLSDIPRAKSYLEAKLKDNEV